MRYRNSALCTLKYVAEMLEEDEDFLRDCSIEMFSEDGCLSAYDDYPASELSEPIVVFTEDGIDNLRHIVDERRAAVTHRRNLAQKTVARNHSHRGPGRMVTLQPLDPLFRHAHRLDHLLECDLMRGMIEPLFLKPA